MLSCCLCESTQTNNICAKVFAHPNTTHTCSVTQPSMMRLKEMLGFTLNDTYDVSYKFFAILSKLFKILIYAYGNHVSQTCAVQLRSILLGQTPLIA